MSGLFATEWLALREPADHASINAQVRAAGVRALAGRKLLRIVDLGCGTGSNLRSLAPAFSPHQHWTLVDLDEGHLEVARSREAEVAEINFQIQISYRQADLSNDNLCPLIEEADLVTASALFDLVSEKGIRRLAAEIAASRAAFYTVLTYDGVAAFLPEHPADQAMREAFNQHQRTDKGFGPAAGPDATDILASAFASHGYTIRRGKSPWVLDHTFEPLRRELDRGWAGAVTQTGLVPGATVEDWLAHRMSAPDAVTIVGHEDLLALPPQQ